MAWIAVAVIVLVFAAAGFAFMKTFGGETLAGHGRIVGANTWRHHAQAWIFLSVAVVSIGTWAYLPLIQGSGMAFQDYRVLEGSTWVGLDNFIEAWNQTEFWTSIRVTLVYVALSLGTGFVVPIFLALMLNEVPRGKIAFRVLYNLPAVISGLITIYLWRAFYEQSDKGMLNQVIAPLGEWGPRLILIAVAGFTVLLLVAAAHFAREGLTKKAPAVSTSLIIGMALTMLVAWWGHEWIVRMWTKSPPIKWLDDKDTALLSVILPGVWGGAGPGCLIYLAALKAIPDEIYEAADLDGAGAWHKVWYVVLPNLKPLILINFVGAFIGTFHSMGNILVMTGSGKELSTHVIGLEIWMNAFLYQKYGYATAVAWILGAFLIGFTIWQLRILKDMKFAANK
ncbi:MAG TPA: sugar ABC transporter permease, partial [Planctomycetota bacterium]|nr:sugar ABC transporter permease [Planctomycetota bacterium]